MDRRSFKSIGCDKICFQTVGARFNAKGDFERILKAMKAPRNLNISR